jgi:hypothetical protein
MIRATDRYRRGRIALHYAVTKFVGEDCSISFFLEKWKGSARRRDPCGNLTLHLLVSHPRANFWHGNDSSGRLPRFDPSSRSAGTVPRPRGRRGVERRPDRRGVPPRAGLSRSAAEPGQERARAGKSTTCAAAVPARLPGCRSRLRSVATTVRGFEESMPRHNKHVPIRPWWLIGVPNDRATRRSDPAAVLHPSAWFDQRSINMSRRKDETSTAMVRQYLLTLRVQLSVHLAAVRGDGECYAEQNMHSLVRFAFD